MKGKKYLRRLLSALVVFTVVAAMLFAMGAADVKDDDDADDEAVVTNAEVDAIDTAAALYALGLFLGTGDDADGNPVFDLDRTINRGEGLVMLIRLLGVEDEALDGDYDCPFDDVPDWLAPYAAYAFAMGLTKGVSATSFAPSSEMTATQYLTFVLRSLGYEDGVDFEWNAAWVLTDELGITHGEYNAANNTIPRGGVADVSFAALAAENVKTGNILLVDLVASGAVDADAAEAFLEEFAEVLIEMGVIDADGLKDAEKAIEDLVEEPAAPAPAPPPPPPSTTPSGGGGGYDDTPAPVAFSVSLAADGTINITGCSGGDLYGWFDASTPSSLSIGADVVDVLTDLGISPATYTSLNKIVNGDTRVPPGSVGKYLIVFEFNASDKLVACAYVKIESVI